MTGIRHRVAMALIALLLTASSWGCAGSSASGYYGRDTAHRSSFPDSYGSDVCCDPRGRPGHYGN